MAFRTQKISQMTPKGSDLEATDLIEVSTIESGSYVTRSITGQELIDAIPVPPSGITIGTTAITSGTVGRVLFEGTGNVVQESGNLFWDNTNGRLGVGTSSPLAIIHSVGSVTSSSAIARANYLNNTLVAAANNDVLVGLDINPTFTNGAFTGVTNISARITGNVTVSNRIVAGGTSFLTGLSNPTYSIQAQLGIQLMSAASTNKYNFIDTDPANFWQARVDAAYGLITIMGVALSAGNYNGTLGNAILTGMTTEIGGALGVQSRIGVKSFIGLDGSTSRYIRFWEPGVAQRAVIGHTDNADGGHIVIKTGDATTLANGVQAIRIFQTTQNVAIGTQTTDAGFRFDVNGTARVSGVTSVITASQRISFNLSQGVYIGQGVNNNAIGANNSNRLFIGSEGDMAIYTLNNGTFIISDIANPASSASAKLRVDSTTQGFLPPRMTQTQRNAIASPAAGLVVYDNTDNKHYGYNGTTWNAFY